MGIWGEAELFLGIWGAKANTFREPMTVFAGRRGDQCIIFRDQGSTDPPGASVVCTLCMQLLLQFYSIAVRLYWCLGHGLKMCILFGYHAQIIFVTFFTKRTQSFFRLKLIDTMYLVYATPPTVYSDSFETLHVFRSWTEDAHILSHELLRVLPPPQGELSRLCFLKHGI